jgi:hypothetical protein
LSRPVALRPYRQLREGAAGNRLERVNAILSTVVVGEHPLGGIGHDRLRKARGELASLLDEQSS